MQSFDEIRIGDERASEGDQICLAMGPMRRRKVEVIAIIGDICPAEAAAERSVFEGCDLARAARRAFNDVNAGDAENIKSIDDILELRLGPLQEILFVGETGEIRHTRALAADFLHHVAVTSSIRRARFSILPP